MQSYLIASHEHREIFTRKNNVKATIFIEKNYNGIVVIIISKNILIKIEECLFNYFEFLEKSAIFYNKYRSNMNELDAALQYCLELNQFLLKEKKFNGELLDVSELIKNKTDNELKYHRNDFKLIEYVLYFIKYTRGTLWTDIIKPEEKLKDLMITILKSQDGFFKFCQKTDLEIFYKPTKDKPETKVETIYGVKHLAKQQQAMILRKKGSLLLLKEDYVQYTQILCVNTARKKSLINPIYNLKSVIEPSLLKFNEAACKKILNDFINKTITRYEAMVKLFNTFQRLNQFNKKSIFNKSTLNLLLTEQLIRKNKEDDKELLEIYSTTPLFNKQHKPNKPNFALLDILFKTIDDISIIKDIVNKRQPLKKDSAIYDTAKKYALNVKTKHGTLGQIMDNKKEKNLDKILNELKINSLESLMRHVPFLDLLKIAFCTNDINSELKKINDAAADLAIELIGLFDQSLGEEELCIKLLG